MFLVIDGVNDGHSVTGPAYYHEGMIWRQFDPATLNSEVWGEISIEFLGCNSAVLSWSSDMEGYGDGQVELERLTHLYGLGCDEMAAELTGEWQADFAEGDDGSFIDMPYTVTVDADGNFEFYDELECLWEGHIHVRDMERGWLTARFGSPSCPSPVPMRFATGRYYSSGLSICNSGGDCIHFDQYLTLYSEDDQGQIINLYFLR